MTLARIAGSWLLFMAAFFGAGRVLWAVLRPPGGLFLRWVISGTLGMGLIGYACYALGTASILRTGPILAVLGCAAAGLAAGRREFTAWRWRFEPTPFFVLTAALGAILFIAAFSPRIDHDALVYHLHLAKIFAQEGRIHSVPTHPNADWPFLFESLFSAAFALGGPVAAKLIHWSAAALQALLVGAFAREQGIPRNAAWAGAAAVLATPLVGNLAAVPYVDLGLSLFTSASLFVWIASRERGSMGGAVAAGLLMGFAFSVKYLAGVALVSWLGVLAYDAVTTRRFPWKGIAVFLIMAALAGGYWYVKVWTIYGNPVHPYFGHLFGGPDYMAHYHVPVPRTFLNWVLLPFWVSYRAGDVSGTAESLGAVVIIFALLALWRPTARRIAAPVLLYAALFMTLWFFFPQNLRFLSGIVAPLAFAAACGISEIRHAGPRVRFAILTLFVALITAQAAWIGYHYRSDLRFVAKREDPAAWLAAHDRAYGVARYLNAHYGRGTRLVPFNETHFYYFDQPIVRPNLLQGPFPRPFDFSLEEGTRRLRAEGVSLILIYDDAVVRRQRFVGELLGASPDRTAALGWEPIVLPVQEGIDPAYRAFRLAGPGI